MRDGNALNASTEETNQCFAVAVAGKRAAASIKSQPKSTSALGEHARAWRHSRRGIRAEAGGGRPSREVSGGEIAGTESVE